ncbi:hypothetical protein F6X40_14440 [Paraburkholderia sp. UCT31]|uniref:hypothetical protein n=1 Tax=unclassified Paraburkholderia TaxID=2615204 RepID=UPI0016555A97|nr:hypothetical protein [Paraburkholderia sp. UCT31]MBC8737992.1 hypothetical protein [Paraburkholderia sp. UCT31]
MIRRYRIAPPPPARIMPNRLAARIRIPAHLVSIIDAGGAEKTSHPNKKVIFVWSSACWRVVEISLIHVDNGPSSRAAPALQGATGARASPAVRVTA